MQVHVHSSFDQNIPGLELLPDQFQFKNGVPEATKLQDLELLPIKKGTLQLDSVKHYELRANALYNEITPKDLGKVLYQFNQLRGYAGGTTLQRLYANNSRLSVKTGGNYLFLVMGKGNKRIFDIVSLYDAAQIAKDELKNRNYDFKKKICEDYRIKHKEKPDKVLFTLQQNELVYLPEDIDNPIPWFTLDDFDKWVSIKENRVNFNKRVYKVVKFTGKDCFFIPHNYANTISIPKDLSEDQKKSLKAQYGEKKIPKKELNFEEFGSFGTSAKTEVNDHFVKKLLNENHSTEPIKIQDHCVKLTLDWLGNIKPIL